MCSLVILYKFLTTGSGHRREFNNSLSLLLINIDKNYDRKDFSRILTLLQESYDCLGFTCADVGAYNNSEVAECAGYESTHPMAGFIPVEDVRSLSKLDLDVLAIRELLRFPSTTSNAAALLYYRFGRSALLDDDRFDYNTLSLREMAKATHRRKYSPYYQVRTTKTFYSICCLHS